MVRWVVGWMLGWMVGWVVGEGVRWGDGTERRKRRAGERMRRVMVGEGDGGGR